jgi:hypothetical protein
MSRQNLIDTIEGVKKHHGSSIYLQQLEEALSKKIPDHNQYVEFLPNQVI